MRLNKFIQLITLLAFALFGGALPVAASGDHVVICGADGVKRIVAFDFETGTPIEVEIAEPECQDCFGIAPILIASPSFIKTDETDRRAWLIREAASMSRRPDARPSARAPPSLIM